MNIVATVWRVSRGHSPVHLLPSHHDSVKSDAILYLNSKSLQLEIVSEIGIRHLYSILNPIKAHRKHEFSILTL